MPAIQFVPPFPTRRGVTLLELLVVLVLMGISAAVVVPALDPPLEMRGDNAAALLKRARQAAISRGEPVRLRIERDGTWALVSLREGVPIGSGRVSSVSAPNVDAATIDLRIDAMGSCTPAYTSAVSMNGLQRFDPLSCRFDSERAQ